MYVPHFINEPILGQIGTDRRDVVLIGVPAPICNHVRKRGGSLWPRRFLSIEGTWVVRCKTSSRGTTRVLTELPLSPISISAQPLTPSWSRKKRCRPEARRTKQGCKKLKLRGKVRCLYIQFHPPLGHDAVLITLCV